MQGSKEGKRANLWGPRTHFGANIPMKIGPEYQCLKKIRSEFQRLQKKHRNSNVLKNKIRIPMFIKKHQNSNSWKNKIRIAISINMATIPMVGRIRSESQCIKK